MTMRSVCPFSRLASVSARETMEEPLTPLLFLVASLAIHLVPTLQFHRMGEAGRLAREGGFSALLVFGVLFSATAAARTISRELSCGTASAALAHGVSRAVFFSAKMAGVLSTFALFAVGMLFATALSSVTSIVGADLAAEGYQDVSVWAPGLALGLGGSVAAFVLAALANRFLGMGFQRTATLWTAFVQIPAFAIAAHFADGAWAELARISGAWIALFAGAASLTALGAALAVRLESAAALGMLSLAVVASFVFPLPAILPDMASFWLVDMLARGAAPHAADVARAIAAGVTLTILWTLVGAALMERREIS